MYRNIVLKNSCAFERNTTMPHNKKGVWTPEPHKAQGYTDKEREAAGNLMRDFDDARSGQNAYFKNEGIKEAITMKVQTLVLNIDGQTVMKNTPQGNKQEDLNRKAADEYRQKNARDERK